MGPRDPGEPEHATRLPGPRHPGRVAALICVLGLSLTVLSTWAAVRADRATEERLLEVQTRQAGTVLSTAVFIVEQPLRTALDVQSVARSEGDRLAFFDQVMTNYVEGSNPLFVSTSLWRERGPEIEPVTRVGADPVMDRDAPDTRAFVDRALETRVLAVARVTVGDQDRIAYALADRRTGWIVKAEAALPENRRATEDGDAAFADLDYAIYLGESTDESALTTTDVDPGDLPLEGRTSTATVPFGDTVITLVATPRRHLGSSLSQRLPPILLVGGLLLTAGAALVAHRLVRARVDAEDNTATISGLLGRVDALYEEQRALSERLQRALLPRADPHVPHLEVAAEYVAGAHGVEIGGDWYSVMSVGPERFAFVVGDVSGRGIDAVAAMARARFTLRAYLQDGDGPGLALEKSSRQFDVALDDHMITALVGVGDARTGEITLATAGHPPPLLASADGSEYVQVPAGPPLGVGAAAYATVSVRLLPGTTLLAFTDGLVERRTEPIDQGLRRLVEVATPVATDPLEGLVTDVVAGMRDARAEDDIAVLALRRSGA